MTYELMADKLDAINDILKNTGFKVSVIEKEHFEQHPDVDNDGQEWRRVGATGRCAIIITNFKDVGLNSGFKRRDLHLDLAVEPFGISDDIVKTIVNEMNAGKK